MNRTLRPLAALAMLAVIVAGCSNAPAGTGSSGGNSIAATHEKAVKFAECMRDNGLSEFPDPDASGALTRLHLSLSELATVPPRESRIVE